MMSIEFVVAYLALGAFVGFMAGLLGIGGGGIMVPLLTSIFLAQGMSSETVVHLALGTSMASMILTSFSSMLSHHKQNNVTWSIVQPMAIGIVIGTFVATFFASKVSSFYLALFFTVFMGYVSVQMFIEKSKETDRIVAGNGGLFVAGGVIGTLSALVSIGGGSLTIPYLTRSNVELKKAIGVSSAIGLPIAVFGTLGYLVNGWEHSSFENYTLGFIYLPAVVLICVVSFFTAPYGVKASQRIETAKLKKIFAVLLGLLSLKMLVTMVS